MKKAIKVLYIVRSLLLIPVMWFIMEMLDVMKNTGFFGIFFLILIFLFVVLGIFGMLFKEHNMNKLLGYNIIYIIFEIFVVVIGMTYLKSISDEFYIMNDDYFKTIFGLFSIIVIGIIANTIIITGMDKQDIDIFDNKTKKVSKKKGLS
ncbi:MAG TPA: hypothetical protein PLT65_03740 [Bacilli bacterium]|nr:hypothetical protein [Bacilli bacterium]